MAQHTLLRSNDNLIVLDGLKDYLGDTFVNDATVTATLYDPSGAAIANATDLSMTYVAGSDGKYTATIPDTVVCSCNRVHTLKVTANGGDGLLGHWEIPILVEDRTQT